MNKVILILSLILVIGCNNKSESELREFPEDTIISNILVSSSLRVSAADSSISSANETQKEKVNNIVTSIKVLKQENGKLKTELFETKLELKKTKNELETIKNTNNKPVDLNEQFKLFPEN